jgi:hypothetical protein
VKISPPKKRKKRVLSCLWVIRTWTFGFNIANWKNSPALTITLLTNITRKSYEDWTHHIFLGLSTSKSWHAFNGWCRGVWLLVHHIQISEISSCDSNMGIFSRNILYDHSLSVATSLKTLTLTCPYKNIRKAQRQLRLIFQCFFSNC